MTIETAEIDTLIWKKSSRSAINGNCVEVAFRSGGGVAVRDSKAAGLGPTLSFENEVWSAFLDQIAAGELRSA